MRRTIVASLAVLAALAVPATGLAASPCEPGEHTATDAMVTSADGTEIAITIMRPGEADCGPVPLLLHGHGWSGSRTTSTDGSLDYGTADVFLDAGYALVSFDHRGHGDSGDVAHSMQPDHELLDYPAILDFLHDEVDWLMREPDSGLARDLVVSGYGASYGGGWQTMTQTVDERLDLLVPYITWHDLADSLAPNGVPRTAWLALLQVGGETLADMAPQLHLWSVETQATNRPPAAAEEHFLRASPISYLDRLDTDALFVQGAPDTLFPLNEAVDNYLAHRANGADAYLLGINSGHILTRIQPTGTDAPARNRVDGCTTDLYGHVIDLLDWKLLGDDDARRRFEAVPRVAVGTEQGTCVVADDWPVNDAELEVELGDLAVPQGAGTLPVPLFTAEEDTTLAGIPTFSATTPLGVDDIFFVSLVLQQGDGFHLIQDQVMPYRTGIAESGEIAFDMGGIATTVPAGASVYLRLEGANEQFVLNGNRRAGALILQDVTVTLPHATAGAVEPYETPRRETRLPRPAGDAADVAASAPTPAAPLPVTGGGRAVAGLAFAAAAAVARLRRRPT